MATIGEIYPSGERPSLEEWWDRWASRTLTRRASAVGVVSVNWQQVRFGQAATGRNIDVWSPNTCSSTTATTYCAPNNATNTWAETSTGCSHASESPPATAPRRNPGA